MTSFSESRLYACNLIFNDQGYYTFVERKKWTYLKSGVHSQSKNINRIYIIGENE